MSTGSYGGTLNLTVSRTHTELCNISVTCPGMGGHQFSWLSFLGEGMGRREGGISVHGELFLGEGMG